MKFTLTALIALIGLGACALPSSPPDNPIMVINTVPSEALLTFDTGFTCTSPCKVALPRPMTVKVAKAGFIPQEQMLEWHPSGAVTWSLTLAAPTTEVEEQSLPAL